MNTNVSLTFNSPLEAGIRAVGTLTAAYPQSFDLYKLVAFDYLVVHTGDVNGPESLHPKLPQQSAELLVRRKLVEDGLLLMMSRGLIERSADETGIIYSAGEMAETFLSSLMSTYLKQLIVRANWVVEHFALMSELELRQTLSEFRSQWMEEFQEVQHSMGSNI